MAEKISVIGPGTMGTGIVQSFLQAGFDVVLIGSSEDSLKNGIRRLSASIGKAVEKGSMTEDQKNSMMLNLKQSTNYGDISGSSIVIEAVPELYDIKTQVLSKAEEYAGNAIIATNTSSIPITKLAEKMKRKEMFLGMHFFNPVPVMKPIELIVTEYTAAETRKKASDIAIKAGKVPIEVKDYPGFVANSVLMPMINEAALLLQKGVASKEGIDQIIKLGLHHPMGPLELADFIGIDVCVDIMDSIYKETEDEKFKPVDILCSMKNENKLGKKTGEGFYKY
ncbi:MAG: 3-hydroxyacyl-CoA dehydrogenase NAD-binding domain-containing protein [Candidatus Marsarchaeota archaeon]|jgi:3-hydroxybutyryl-CoA dehydrogenase|nr:3-hydroxyacyl-CoA dehydrogenase NAD-binding domain-containing protein [Candidatus Marsarchaeota archaeon]